MNIKRKIKVGTLIGVIVIGLFSTSTAQATTTYGRTCEINVHPFDDSKPETNRDNSNGADRFLHTILDTRNNNECSSHLRFTETNGYPAGDDQTYNPDPPLRADNTLANGAEDFHMPVSQHEHAYFNDSTTDDGNYHFAELWSFQIKVHLNDDRDDTLNIDPENLVCDMPEPVGISARDHAKVLEALQSCQTTETLNIYGGTTITKSTNNNIVTITWRFGENPDGQPAAIPGKNGDNFQYYDRNGNPVGEPLDLNSDDNLRTLGQDGTGFAVNMVSENDPGAHGIWSATTTSTAQILDYFIPTQRYSPRTAFDGWRAVSDRLRTVNVGSVSTVWRKPELPPETTPTTLTLIKQVVDENNVLLDDQSVADSFQLFARKYFGTPITENAQNNGAANNPNVRRRAGAVLPLGGSLFGLNVDFGQIETAEMNLANGDTLGFRSGDTHDDVTPGATYTITEDRKDGYVLDKVECRADANEDYTLLPANHRVTIAEGTNVVCILTNKISGDEDDFCPNGEIIPPNGVCDEEEEEECPVGSVDCICPVGTQETEDGTRCEPIVCPEGFQLNGNRCEPIIPECIPGMPGCAPVCPIGSINCFCPVGTVNIGNVCVPEVPVCPPGFPGCTPFNPIPSGRFEKTVRTRVGTGNVINRDEWADYKLTFTATRYVNDVTIHDETFKPLGNGFGMTGTKGGHLSVVPLGNFSIVNGVRVSRYYSVTKTTSAGTYEVSPCGPISFSYPGSSYSSCYEGNPFIGNGVHVTQVASGESVSVEFTAVLSYSLIGPEFCNREVARNVGFCGEEFINHATAIDSEGARITASTKLYTPCPFLLTRGLGDVILEQGFSYGTDIYSCFDRPNIEGEIIQPIELPVVPLTPGAGTAVEDTNYLKASNQICKDSNKETNTLDAYKNPFKNLSSGLCELKQSITESLTSKAIRQAISDNIVRFTRENANLNVAGQDRIGGPDINGVASVDNGVGLSNPNYKVYKRQGDLRILGTDPVGKGARTFIVQGGNLIITKDIRFDETAVREASFKETPSIAFIVIGGDIQIGKDVQHLDGVYVAIKDAAGNGGRITGPDATTVSNKPLAFNGAVVGDIEPLFMKRTFAGDAKANQGTIVITYGAWLYYNLPPVLRDLVDLQQEQTAR